MSDMTIYVPSSSPIWIILSGLLRHSLPRLVVTRLLFIIYFKVLIIFELIITFLWLISFSDRWKLCHVNAICFMHTTQLCSELLFVSRSHVCKCCLVIGWIFVPLFLSVIQISRNLMLVRFCPIDDEEIFCCFIMLFQWLLFSSFLQSKGGKGNQSLNYIVVSTQCFLIIIKESCAYQCDGSNASSSTMLSISASLFTLFRYKLGVQSARKSS